MNKVEMWPYSEEEKAEYNSGLEDGLSDKEPLREPWEPLGHAQDPTIFVPHKGDTP